MRIYERHRAVLLATHVIPPDHRGLPLRAPQRRLELQLRMRPRRPPQSHVLGVVVAELRHARPPRVLPERVLRRQEVRLGDALVATPLGAGGAQALLVHGGQRKGGCALEKRVELKFEYV